MSTQAGAVSGPYPIIAQISPTANINQVLQQLAVSAGGRVGSVVDCIPDCSNPSLYLLNVPVLPLPSAAALAGIQCFDKIQCYDLNESVTLPRFSLRADATGRFVFGVTGSPADWYKAQPAMQLINAAKALPISTGRGVVVADINSRVDSSHPALSSHLTPPIDFIASQPSGFRSLDQSDAGFLDQSDAGFLDQSDAGFLDQLKPGFLDLSNLASLDGLNPAYSHGSLSAGVIAAIAPDSTILPLRVFDDQGRSDYFTLAKAIRYAVDHGAQIINLNFGIPYGFISYAIKNAVQYAQASNVLLVAPDGNDSTSLAQYPAAFPGVLAAAATNLSDTLALFSNYGSDVFVDAPGVDIISTFPSNPSNPSGYYYSLASGTTLSAALVAGTAALARSLRTNGVSDSIARTAHNIDPNNPGYQNQLGHGRIDVFGAVLSSLQPVATATSVTSAPNASTFGQMVVFTATVSSASPGAATPPGTVIFYDGSAAIGTGTLNAAGVATFNTAGLPAGVHAITAAYGATNNFSASTSPVLTQTVNKANTLTSVTSSSDPSAVGTAVTFTATVNAVSPGAGTPTGTITFGDGSVILGTAAVNGSGQATLMTSSLTLGVHSIIAAYNGDANFIISASGSLPGGPQLPGNPRPPLSQIIYAYPAGGIFVIADLNAVVGNQVTFWGAQWAKSNTLSGGRTPSAFKGFADSTSLQLRSWTSSQGNSSAPPASIPQYMAVIVSDSIMESGSKISGDIARMAVVQTDPGYGPNPGHSGTGTVLALFGP